MAGQTTLRIGGAAELCAFCAAQDQVAQAIHRANAQGTPWRVLGHGSNILAADEGVSGAVIFFCDETAPHITPDGSVTVSGGYSLFDLVTLLARKGYAGIENLAGIPGTVAGAIAGNAGAYGTTIGDLVRSVKLINRAGRVYDAKPEELGFVYRHSRIKDMGDAILEATIATSPQSPEPLLATIEERLTDRRKKHPDYRMIPTAGSYFKNPPGGENGHHIAAGKLLEEAGCKEFAVGGARLWHRHANIIINNGKATASDVRKLAAMMREKIESAFKITLEPEVTYLSGC